MTARPASVEVTRRSIGKLKDNARACSGVASAGAMGATLSASISYAVDIWGGQRRMVEALRARADAQRYTVLATGETRDLTLTRSVTP